MSNQHDPSIRAAAAQCARSMGKGLAQIAGLIAGVALLYEAGLLLGTGWTAWQAFLTNQWTNVWPATWTVWTCTVLAVWCACMTHKLRHSSNCLWFAAACATLLLLGVLPANCAVWATTEGWDIEGTPLIDRLAGVSAFAYTYIAFVAAPVCSILWLHDKIREFEK